MRVLVFAPLLPPSYFILLQRGDTLGSEQKKRKKKYAARSSETMPRSRELNTNTIVMLSCDLEIMAVSARRFIFSTFGRESEQMQRCTLLLEKQ